jgi:transposase
MIASAEMDAPKSTKRKTQKHSLELKISVARQVIEGGKNQAELARSTGISPTNIHKWVYQGRHGQLLGYQAPAFDERTGDLVAEVKRLERELASVTHQRDFLKKVSAFFAKEAK